MIHLVRTQIYPKKLTFLNPCYTHVSWANNTGAKKYQFLGKFCVRTKCKIPLPLKLKGQSLHNMPHSISLKCLEEGIFNLKP